MFSIIVPLFGLSGFSKISSSCIGPAGPEEEGRVFEFFHPITISQMTIYEEYFD